MKVKDKEISELQKKLRDEGDKQEDAAELKVDLETARVRFNIFISNYFYLHSS